jgi:hypothetical protein
MSGAQVCITNSPGRQPQSIQNTADNKQSAQGTKGINGIKL